MCLGVHLPYSPKWYWPVEGFFGVPEMDRYFDRNQIFFQDFLKTGREFFYTLMTILWSQLRGEGAMHSIFQVLSLNSAGGT